MLSFKDLQEVLQPKAAGEKRFKDKHVADTIDYPLNDAEINKGTKKSPAKKKRIADSEEGKDAAVYEENEKMTPAQEKKREEIVMAMKKDKEKLQSRYGESWKAVMYATATKQAMSESVDLDEDVSVYKKTARKNKNDVTYAFGRTKKLDGQPKEKGGYWVWKLSKNYDGKVRGGIRNSWVYVEKDLSYSDAVKLMNKKLGRKEFKEEVELDEALPPHLAKYIGKDGDFTPEVKKRLGKDFMRRMKVPSKKKPNAKDVTPKGYGPDEELDESAAGIAQLKKAYEPMRGKKISLDNAKKLSAIMDKFADDKAMLMKLVKADIPFVTQSAVTKLITKHNMKGAEINKMMKEEKALTTDARYKTFKEKLLKLGYQKADIDEAKYELYHKDFSGAMQHAYHVAKKHHGITIDPEEIDNKVATGPRKPSEGKTNTYRLKGDKGAVQIQVYNKGGSKPFELNMYKEEVDLDEAFKINATNQKLDDGSMVKISKDDASALNGLYNSLNPANAKTMIKKMMQDKKTYGEILAFAKQAM